MIRRIVNRLAKCMSGTQSKMDASLELEIRKRWVETLSVRGERGRGH